MQRIDTSTKFTDLFGTGKHGFRDGNKVSGISATAFDAAWCNAVQEEISNVVEASGASLNPAAYNQLLTAINSLISSYSMPLMLVADEKASGVDAAASVAGVQTRVLNTVRHNSIPSASLASNQITLPAGSYLVEGEAPAINVTTHHAYIYNVTVGAIALHGSNADNSNPSSPDSCKSTSTFFGKIVLAATTVLELRHWTQSVGILGWANNQGLEVYSQLKITRIG
jgi:hypothetical protein